MRLLSTPVHATALAAWVCVLIGLPSACAHVEEARFCGTVTAIDFGCYSDGLCQITVDGHEIPFGQGWSRAEWGQIAGLPANGDIVGMSAEIYARKYEGRSLHIPDWYTLEGSHRYFVHLFRRTTLLPQATVRSPVDGDAAEGCDASGPSRPGP